MFQDLDQIFSKMFVKNFARGCQNYFQRVEEMLLCN